MIYATALRSTRLSATSPRSARNTSPSIRSRLSPRYGRDVYCCQTLCIRTLLRTLRGGARFWLGHTSSPETNMCKGYTEVSFRREFTNGCSPVARLRLPSIYHLIESYRRGFSYVCMYVRGALWWRERGTHSFSDWKPSTRRRQSPLSPSSHPSLAEDDIFFCLSGALSLEKLEGLSLARVREPR